MRNVLRFISLLLVLSLCTCAPSPESPLFSLKTSAETGITFANHINEDDTYNILDFEFVYNGGGVAVADFNGDGLEDLYLTGNQVANAMYLNKGDLTFADITEQSNTGGAERWCSGVVAGDVNG
ncbi:MAG: VCBS repeat-containing protein, partial [Bacteroidota bacterium]